MASAEPAAEPSSESTRDLSLSAKDISGIFNAILATTDLDQQLDLLMVIVCMKDKLNDTLSKEYYFIIMKELMKKALKHYSNVSVNDSPVVKSVKSETVILCLDLLIQISTVKEARKYFIKYDELITIFFEYSNKGFEHSTRLASLLVNLSNDVADCEILSTYGDDFIADHVLNAILESSVDGVDANLGPFSAVLMNMTQAHATRRFLLSPANRKEDVQTNIGLILPLVSRKSMSSQIRLHIAGMLKNCCFDSEFHPILLGEEIYPFFLIQLVGPEAADLDNKDIPVGGTDPEAMCRYTILEAFYQLCSIRKSRQVLRDLNVYHLLRDLHLWEKSETNKGMIEDVVNLLIQTEDEIGLDDFKKLAISKPGGEESESEEAGPSSETK